MGEIVGFVSKSERERLRLIRETRAIYDSIFPPTDAIGGRPVNDLAGVTQPGWRDPLPRKETSGG
jgi:hypothetical protein